MPRVTEEYRQQQRARVLAAARREFARNGFKATTMPDIISAAGMSPGGVYRYFSGKDEIIAVIAAEVARWHSDAVARVLVRAPDDWRQAFRLLLDELAGHEETLGRLALIVWGESQRDPLMARVAGEAVHAMRTNLVDLMTRAGQSTGTAPDTMGQIMFSLTAGFILQRRLTEDVDVNAYADAAIDALEDTQDTDR